MEDVQDRPSTQTAALDLATFTEPPIATVCRLVCEGALPKNFSEGDSERLVDADSYTRANVSNQPRQAYSHKALYAGSLGIKRSVRKYLGVLGDPVVLRSVTFKAYNVRRCMTCATIPNIAWLANVEEWFHILLGGRSPCEHYESYSHSCYDDEVVSDSVPVGYNSE